MARRSAKQNTAKRLPKALVRQLGKRSDSELADEFDVPVEVVRRERVLRGDSGRGIPVGWTEKKLALLGTASDAEIAGRLGLTPTSVKQQRRRLGIPAYGTTTDQRRHQWTKRQIAWLGKLPDKEIAGRLGISVPSVCWKRQLLGIEPVGTTGGGRQWTDEEIALLGTLPDAEVARQLGLHRHRVALKRRLLGIPNAETLKYEQRWTPEVIAKLGQVPDREVAEEMGVSPGIVTAYRNRHQIPLAGKKHSAGNKRGRIRWLRELVERLGTVPDDVLAQELGTTRQTVAQARKRFGIPAFRASS